MCVPLVLKILPLLYFKGGGFCFLVFFVRFTICYFTRNISVYYALIYSLKKKRRTKETFQSGHLIIFIGLRVCDGNVNGLKFLLDL